MRFPSSKIRAPQRNPYLFAVIVLLFIFLMIIIPFYHHKNTCCSASSSPQPSATVIFSNDGGGDPLNTRSAFHNAPSNSAGLMPINMSTQPSGNAGIGGSGYQQVGILEGSGDDAAGADGQMILPLMGRLCLRNRNKWQYYTMGNGVGSIHNRLNITVNGKSCSKENGCDELNNGDIAIVQGYSRSTFRISLYENRTLEYIPMI